MNLTSYHKTTLWQIPNAMSSPSPSHPVHEAPPLPAAGHPHLPHGVVLHPRDAVAAAAAAAAAPLPLRPPHVAVHPDRAVPSGAVRVEEEQARLGHAHGLEVVARARGLELNGEIMWRKGKSN